MSKTSLDSKSNCLPPEESKSFCDRHLQEIREEYAQLPPVCILKGMKLIALRNRQRMGENLLQVGNLLYVLFVRNLLAVLKWLRQSSGLKGFGAEEKDMLSRNCDSRQQSGMQRVGSMRTVGLATLVGFIVAALLPALVTAQGVLLDIRPNHPHRLPRPIHPPHPIPHPIRPPIPRPAPTSYKIQELAVNVNLVDQIAKVQVSQSFVNTGSRAMEVCFVFPLPYDGAVDRLTFLVDGKEYDAKLLNAKEARRIYEGYIRRNQDPALLEWMGTGMFKTSVFPVPAGAKRTVTLRYSQVCRKLDGLTEFLFPLSTAKYTSHPVENLRFAVNIQSRVAIKNVYSPTHSVEIKRPNDEHAVVQLHQKNRNSQFRFPLVFRCRWPGGGRQCFELSPGKGQARVSDDAGQSGNQETG